MDEHVRKAPSLLDELAVVVRDIEVAESWDCTVDQMRCFDGSGCECAMRGCDRPDVEGDAVDFIRTHHAEIAEAVRDAGRYRWLRREDCPVDFTEMRWECDEGLDNYIDAAMHNSAREAAES